MSSARGTLRRPDQLPLGVTLRRRCTFANFVNGANAGATAVLREALSAAQGVVYLWGGAGTGKSHLLEACCNDASVRDLRDL